MNNLPDFRVRFDRAMTRLKDGDTIKLEVAFRARDIDVRRAVLKLAYLAVFDRFLYRYALSEAAEEVRAMIRGSNDDLVRRVVSTIQNVEEVGLKKPVVMADVNDSGAIVAHFVFVRFAERKMYFGVLIPSATLAKDSVTTILTDLSQRR